MFDLLRPLQLLVIGSASRSLHAFVSHGPSDAPLLSNHQTPIVTIGGGGSGAHHRHRSPPTRSESTRLTYRNDPEILMELAPLDMIDMMRSRSSVDAEEDAIRPLPPRGGTAFDPSSRGREVKSHEEAWNGMYDRLKAFRSERGHCNVPYGHPPDRKLAVWVTYQRRAMKRRKLTERRVVALEALGFAWSARTPWRVRFEELAEFRDACGHCRVPYDSEEHAALYRWLENQRQQHRAMRGGFGGPMTEGRAAALTSLGAIRGDGNPDADGRRERVWMDRYRELQRYRLIHDHSDVPRGHEGGLGRWVDTQRTAYRLRAAGGASPMTNERARLLEEDSVGIDWGPERTAWEERAERLRRYREENCSDSGNDADGDWCINITGDKALDGWVRAQQYQYRALREGRRSRLTPESVETLEQLGINLLSKGRGGADSARKRRRTSWKARYGQLKKYRDKSVHHRVPPQSTALGQWVKAQMRQHRLKRSGERSSLTDEREAKLSALGLFGQTRAAAVGSKGASSVSLLESSQIISPLVPFITVTMNDREKLQAWRLRFQEFK